ncbi:Membrane protein [Streptomyces clavuligerus]|uniref:Membrane protein n=1 Tax=Streptomyces clavuligerus TaxID=1901 RepID=E2Q541_STRCL|nr:Membrane protein [Streptomyces clavuligerus]
MTDDGGSAVSDARTPAQIEADIVRRREQLAETLDEIGVRVHPSTIVGDARARVAEKVDRTAGRAFAAVHRTVDGVRARFVGVDGEPRMDRVLPAAAAVVLVGLIVLSSRSSRKHGE